MPRYLLQSDGADKNPDPISKVTLRAVKKKSSGNFYDKLHYVDLFSSACNYLFMSCSIKHHFSSRLSVSGIPEVHPDGSMGCAGFVVINRLIPLALVL